MDILGKASATSIKRLDTEIELAKGQLQDAETAPVSAS